MSHIQPVFLFDDRRKFEADCEHDRLRSKLHSNIDLPPTNDPWKQHPVDFTMKNFHPNRKKNINLSSIDDLSSKEKQSEIAQFHNSSVMKPFSESYQNPMKEHLTNDNDNQFLLDTRIKYDHIKRILITDQYKNPQPYDYRQYPNIKELGLAEFYTAYDRDPFKIRFLSDHLNTLWLQEREHERIPIIEKPLSEMDQKLTERPKWDSRLILPKLVFPNKYAAYTRYRNPTRTVQSAYWERVEDHFEQKKRLDVI